MSFAAYYYSLELPGLNSALSRTHRRFPLAAAVFLTFSLLFGGSSSSKESLRPVKPGSGSFSISSGGS